jgi:hypothetical protein
MPGCCNWCGRDLTVSCLAEGAGNRREKPVAERCHGRGALDRIHDDGKDVDNSQIVFFRYRWGSEPGDARDNLRRQLLGIGGPEALTGSSLIFTSAGRFQSH